MDVIEIKSLVKDYGNKRAVDNINISIKEGDIVGFIGPNGAGKSTTIKTLFNFIYPTSGECKVFGMDCIKDAEKIREKVGYVPSEVNFYKDVKVKDILKYAASFYKNLDKNKVDGLCKKLDVDLNKKMGDLSLGNKKKVAIIQAIIHSPKLIVLDEPTNGLDPLMQQRLFEILLEENKKGATIFLSSHNLMEVQNYCHKAIIIKEGKIIDIKDMTSLKELKKKKISIVCEEITEILIKDIGGERISKEDEKIVFFYKKDINELLVFLSKYKIKDISIGEEDLMDSFLDYYKGGNE